MSTRWGIAGPGKMAAAMVADFGQVSNGSLVAVGSRSEGRAREFADEHGIPKAHGSYAALLADPEVDAIYIATPHPQHTDVALSAIEAGKAILVEKAFTATVSDTERIVDAARGAGVFAMEAMWTRFNPGIVRVRELVDAGAIGQVRGVQGDLTAFRHSTRRIGFSHPSSGAVRCSTSASTCCPSRSTSSAPRRRARPWGLFPSGVEGAIGVLLGYDDGRSATLSGAFTAYGPGRMMLIGSEGWIDVHPRFHRAPSITVWRGKEQVGTEEFTPGYHHEVIHVGECLAQGLTESPIMPLDDTIAVQRLMQEVLDQVRR